MIARRRFAIPVPFVLILGLVAPAAHGFDIVVNFNDLTYSAPFDPNEQFPAGQAHRYREL